MKLTLKDMITVYYYGNADSCWYECQTVSVKTFRKWRKDGNPKAKDIAFIYKGYHSRILSYELESFKERNKDKELHIYQVMGDTQEVTSTT